MSFAARLTNGTNVTLVTDPREPGKNYALRICFLEGPFSLTLTNLVPGDNVLAVGLYQSGAASGDAMMAVELTAEIVSYSSHLTIVREGNAVVVRHSGPGVLQEATLGTSGGPPSILAADWADVPGNPNPYTFIPSGGRVFRLRSDTP